MTVGATWRLSISDLGPILIGYSGNLSHALALLPQGRYALQWRLSMLTDYLEAAMKRAEYEHLADGSWWGRIAGFKGLWADGLTEKVVFSLDRQIPVPVVDGIDLTVTEVA